MHPSFVSWIFITIKKIFISYSNHYLITLGCRCQDDSEVTNLGQIFYLNCSSEGDLIAPDPWPDCRAASVCTNIPEAPVDSKLQNTGDFTSVTEFRYASYPCKGKFHSIRSTYICSLGSFKSTLAYSRAASILCV